MKTRGWGRGEFPVAAEAGGGVFGGQRFSLESATFDIDTKNDVESYHA